MSNILFLDNGEYGKNNRYRYILTIGITFIGGTFASLFFIVLLIVIYSLILNINETSGFINILNNPLLFLIIVGVSYGIYYLLFYLCIRFIHKKKFMLLINIENKIKWVRILKGAGLWAAILFLFTFISIINNESGLSYNSDLVSFIYLLIIGLIIFPIQASFEEIFFRGYLMQGFGLLSKKPVLPLIFTTLIFGLIHFFNGTTPAMSISIVISALILGLMLGIIVLGENGLETAMGAHIANNMFIAFFLNSSDSGLGNLPSLITTQSSDPFSGIPVLILMACVMIIILFWNKKANLKRIIQ